MNYNPPPGLILISLKAKLSQKDIFVHFYNLKVNVQIKRALVWVI